MLRFIPYLVNMDLSVAAFLLPTSQTSSIICYVTFLHITDRSAVLIMYHTSPPVLKVRGKKSITGPHVDSCQPRSVSAKGLFIKPPGAKADGFLQLLDIFCCYNNRLDGFGARGNNIIPKPSNVIQGLEPIHKAVYIGL